MTSLLNKHQTWPQNQLSEEEEGSGETSTAPVRKRTRATADQLSVLEDTFAVNVSPNSKLRKQLAEQLQMSERSIQIWFQNRRAKVKHMQKRAQMQMHQASIRAQLYQYHQQQQQQQQHQHQQHQQPPILPMQPYPYYYNNRLAASNTPRAQSVDAVHFQNNNRPMIHQPVLQQQLFTPASSVPPPMYPYSNSWLQLDDMPLTRQSMPPQVYPYDFTHDQNGLDFPEYLHGQASPSPSPLHKQQQNIPTLISVPDAGPTAILATSTNSNTQSTSPTPSSPDSTRQNTIDPSNLMIGKEELVVKSEHNPLITTTTTTTHSIKEQEDEDEEPKDLYLSATTLTIGTWHRLKMHETDLVCVYRPDTRTFAWHIVDGGCHFKMEVTQDAVSSIEFILDENEALADVHFDISEPPLFYMESTTTMKQKKDDQEVTTPVWVQCSDFTEGKQASRFFRHTLKGLSHHMKQELLALIHNHEETRRLVHFIAPTYPIQGTFMNPNMYWPTQPHVVDSLPCELYMS
ncbi:hypothetical protein BDF21DRAFT_369480 [Thamnidium elegans]|nr:hypothetical protein BDF21DRAFT_369480 [Thamnidium elegans]